MDILFGDWRLYSSTFLVCLVSGVIPLVSAELYLVSLSTLSPPSLALPLILASTMGQMTAKAALYGVGRGVLKLPLNRYEKKLAEARQKLMKNKTHEWLMIFTSASTGLPSFYVTSLAAGALKLSLSQFLLSGSLGRFVRFSAIVFFPQMIKQFWH